MIICSICLNNLNVSKKNISVLNCGHIFHHDSLQKWFQIRKTCPEYKCKVGKNFLVILYFKISKYTKAIYNERRDRFNLFAKNNVC